MEPLEDFSDSTINIEEQFADEKLKTSMPDATARNQAALLALLEDEESVEDSYVNTYTDLVAGGSEYVDMKYGKIEARARNANHSALVNMLGDPSIALTQKEAAMATVGTTPVSLHKEVSIAAASQENVDADVFQEAVIQDTRTRMSEEFQYREWEQAQINRTIAQLDPDFKGLVTDVVEWVVPGSVTAEAMGVLSKVSDALGLGDKQFSLADAKVDIRQRLGELPPAQRKEAMTKVLDIIRKNSGLVFKDRNNLEAITLLEQVGLTGEYGEGTKTIDAFAQVLDAIGVGQLFKSGTRAAGRILNKVTGRRIADQPSPLAPLPIVIPANPSKARELYAVAVQTDEVAIPLTGVNKTDLIIHTESTQPLVSNSAVEAKLVDPIRNIDEAIREASTESGGIRFTDNELKKAAENARRSFKNAIGVTRHDNYTQVGVEGDSVVLRGFYGDSEGGFRTAEEALAKARYAMRGFPVSDDSMKIFSREADGTYRKLDTLVPGQEGDFLVSLEIRQPITEKVVGEFDPLTYKLNYFDRFSMLWSKYTGSVTQNLVDAASVLPPNITGAAEVAFDRSLALDKLVMTLGDDFAKSSRKLAGPMRDNLNRAIMEGNFTRTAFTDLELTTKFGLDADALEVMAKWRKAQDTNHWLSNLTLVKNFRNTGYKVLHSGNARLFGKPISKNGNLGKLYDPDSDAIITLSKQELDDLYDSGGTLAKLKSPESIKGEVVTHFISKETPTTYLRELTDSDQVLNYIPGYFKLYYESPRFVVRNFRGPDGNMYEKAVAVSGTWEEASAYLKNAAAREGVSPEKFGRVRSDVKDGIEDFEYDLVSTMGGVNQRHRGATLGVTGQNTHIGETGYILDPSESFIKSAAAIAKRVATQDSLDTMKRRLMTSFKDQMPADGSFPSSLSQIGKKGDSFSAEARDARTLWQYIQMQEAGLVNGIDDMSKAIFKQLSISAGKKGATSLEKMAGKASNVGPLQTLSQLTHRALITYNPLRQWIVQPSQALRLFGYNPRALGRATNDLKILSESWVADQAAAVTGVPAKHSKEALEIREFIRKWGGLDGVDRNILVEGPLRDLSRSSNAFTRIGSKVADAPAKMGFDPSEKLNMAIHALTVRQDKIGKGFNVLDPRIRDGIYAEARALTLSLNEAGQMPYNRTSISLFTKFLQIPHKAITLATVNRRLPAAVKARIAMADIMLFGAKASAIGALIGADLLPEDPKMRELVEFGLLTRMYNAVMLDMFGIETHVNFGSINPYDISGWQNLFAGAMEDGFGEVIARTPTGGLIAGSNPRLTNAIAKGFDFIRRSGVENDPVTFVDTIKEFAKISGGFNNYVKAAYILETNKELSRTGVVIREGVSNLEALHALFGFPQTTEAAMFASTSRIINETKDRKEDIRKGVKHIMSEMRNKYNVGVDDLGQNMRIFQELNRVYTTPEDYKTALDEFARLAKNKEDWFYTAMLRYAGFASDDEIRSTLKASGMPEEDIQNLMTILVDDVKALPEELKKLKGFDGEE